jgi:trehalose 6-phosphate synthase
MEQGLSMPIQERRERHKALFERVRKNDATHWRESFLSALTLNAEEALA